MDGEKDYSVKAILRFAGAFIAWVIGSGFATGQEILQFFTSFGYFSYGAVLINLAGFLFLGQVLLVTGYEHRAQAPFDQFKYFCGEKLGALYGYVVPVTLVFIMSVLISGAGATLYEYYGVNHYIGSALMAAMVLCAYLVGFERLVKIVSAIGPVIIIFSLLVGTVTAVRQAGHFADVPSCQAVLRQSQSSPHWLLSAVLYMSSNIMSGSAYYTELGISAQHRKDAKYGALLGAAALVSAIAIMNTAILLSARETAVLAIPMLHLAKQISYAFGAVFSIVLILGMFSSCSAIMWSVCHRFTLGGKRGNQRFAVGVAAGTFVMGLFSFRDLVAVLYPLEGYIGLIFIVCVIAKRVRRTAPV